MSLGTLKLDIPHTQNITPGHAVSPGTLEVMIATGHNALLVYSAGAARAKDSQFERQASTAVSDTIASGDYGTTLARVEQLRREDIEDDRPSEFAYQCALNVLVEAGRELGLKFPRASASVGPNRGLRITWSLAAKEVRLICGGTPANRSYIYSESGPNHGVDHTVNGDQLAQHLRWALSEL